MIIQSDYAINEKALIDFKALCKEYEVVSSIEIDYNNVSSKFYLVDKTNKQCRFCKQSYPSVTFSSIAHAIPEFTGNKSLIAGFECDKCNQYFSSFENEFANFMLPYNALGGVKKKGNKFPKYKQDIIVYHEKENFIHIDNYPERLDSDVKEIELNLSTPSYIPNYVYRSLVKIGLAIIPENVFDRYNHVLNWLMDISSKTIFPASMIFSIFPFSNPSDKIRCVVLSRREEINREIPNTILVLSYQNFSFQIFFPVSISESKNILRPFPFMVPTPLLLNLDLVNETVHHFVDLSKRDRNRDYKANIIIKPID